MIEGTNAGQDLDPKAAAYLKAPSAAGNLKASVSPPNSNCVMLPVSFDILKELVKRTVRKGAREAVRWQYVGDSRRIQQGKLPRRIPRLRSNSAKSGEFELILVAVARTLLFFRTELCFKRGDPRGECLASRGCLPYWHKRRCSPDGILLANRGSRCAAPICRDGG